MLDVKTLKVGDRVVANNTNNFFNLCSITKGERGVVVAINPNAEAGTGEALVEIKFDDKKEDLDEWDNTLHVGPDSEATLEDFDLYVFPEFLFAFVDKRELVHDALCALAQVIQQKYNVKTGDRASVMLSGPIEKMVLDYINAEEMDALDEQREPKVQMTPIKYYCDDGTEKDVLVPTENLTCGRCRGKGQHSLRIGAITADEWNNEWDEDSRELYMSGGMDEKCEVCNGHGKVTKPIMPRDATYKPVLEFFPTSEMRDAVLQFYRLEDDRIAEESERRAESRMLGEY